LHTAIEIFTDSGKGYYIAMLDITVFLATRIFKDIIELRQKSIGKYPLTFLAISFIATNNYKYYHIT